MRRGLSLEIAAATALVTATTFALVVPADEKLGHTVHILFVHVPAAWLAYLAFGITLIGSIAYLITRSMKWDHLAGASAEVGVYFTGLTLALGMIWGRSTWGVWWTWDARLVLTAIMFFVYLGYLGLRRSIYEPESRARRAAWLGILGALQIPIVHFSVIWWRGLHQPPTVVRRGEVQMDASYFASLAVALVAFTVVYVVLVRRRIELSHVEDAIDRALAAEDGEVAGAAVAAPALGEVN